MDDEDEPVGEYQAAFERVLRQDLPVLVRREIAEYHSGPLPPGRTLREYDDLLPGSASMIFENFDEQSKHRREMERYALRWGNIRSFVGLACGLIVTLAFLWVSYQLVMNGHEVAGTILGTIDLVALVGVFVYGSQALRSERIERAKIMAGRDEEPARESDPAPTE